MTQLQDHEIIGCFGSREGEAAFESAHLALAVAADAIQEMESCVAGAVRGQVLTRAQWDHFVAIEAAFPIVRPVRSLWTDARAMLLQPALAKVLPQGAADLQGLADAGLAQLLDRTNGRALWLVEGIAERKLRTAWDSASRRLARDVEEPAELRQLASSIAFTLELRPTPDVWALHVHCLRLEGREVAADGMIQSARKSFGDRFANEMMAAEEAERRRDASGYVPSTAERRLAKTTRRTLRALGNPIHRISPGDSQAA